MPKYFNRQEFACKCGCGFNTIDYELLDVLEDAREHFAAPMNINSGCRCKTHNQYVGGAYDSEHLLGRAADVVVKGVDPLEVYKYLNKKYPHKLGLGKYKTFTHVDTRNDKARF